MNNLVLSVYKCMLQFNQCVSGFQSDNNVSCKSFTKTKFFYQAKCSQIFNLLALYKKTCISLYENYKEIMKVYQVFVEDAKKSVNKTECY